MKNQIRLSIVFLVSIFLILGVYSSSMAYSNAWKLDLSSLGLGTYSNIDRIDVNGGSTVNQSFGADGIFNDGDTFTELAQLNQVLYFEEPGNAGNLKIFTGVVAAGKNMYVYASGLQGTAYDVSTPNLADPSTWTFKYSFTPGVGTIGMYIDSDLDPTNGFDQTLTMFDLLFGGGIGNPGFLGGAENNGTTNITAAFNSPMAGVFSADGMDFASFPAGWALGLLNTNNQVIANTFQIYAGATPTGFGGFNVGINNAGQMNVDVVPEPTTMILMGLGLLGLAGISRRRLFNK